MALPDNSIALSLSPEEIADLRTKLSALRHNVNNHLALIMAAAELMRRKPEMAERLLDNILQQPDRIIQEVRSFSTNLECLLGRGKQPTATVVPASAAPVMAA